MSEGSSMGRRVILKEPLLIIQRLFASTRSCPNDTTTEVTYMLIKGDLDRAIADFTESIRLGYDDAEHLCCAGSAYSEKGELEKAIADETEAILLDSENGNAYFNRGIGYGKKGDHNKAIADLTEAILLNPKDAEAYYSRGASTAEW